MMSNAMIQYIQDQYERDSPMYTTLETPAQPNYSLGPPYTSYSQAPYYNYRAGPHYTSDILTTPASTYTGFHRADSHPQPFAYDGLSKFLFVFTFSSQKCIPLRLF